MLGQLSRVSGRPLWRGHRLHSHQGMGLLLWSGQATPGIWQRPGVLGWACHLPRLGLARFQASVAKLDTDAIGRRPSQGEGWCWGDS